MPLTEARAARGAQWLSKILYLAQFPRSWDPWGSLKIHRKKERPSMPRFPSKRVPSRPRRHPPFFRLSVGRLTSRESLFNVPCQRAHGKNRGERELGTRREEFISSNGPFRGPFPTAPSRRKLSPTAGWRRGGEVPASWRNSAPARSSTAFIKSRSQCTPSRSVVVHTRKPVSYEGRPTLAVCCVTMADSSVNSSLQDSDRALASALARMHLREIERWRDRLN